MLELSYTEEQIAKRVINKHLFKTYRSLSMIKNGYWIYIHKADNDYICFNNKNLENRTVYVNRKENGINHKDKTTLFDVMTTIRIKGFFENPFDVFIPKIYVNYIKHVINKKRQLKQ